jgi:SAM-dependent methyltransferase
VFTARRVLKWTGKHISRAWVRAKGITSREALSFQCPACTSAVAGFFRYGTQASWGCPKCGASPRERLINVAINSGALKLRPASRILQIAPSEKSLTRRFQNVGQLTLGDLHPELYDLAKRVDLMDMSDIGRFDLIYASHVLEHVPNDKVALSNLANHLEPSGEVWLLVPLADGPTRDGRPDMSPLERERAFGQWDHLRQYGSDFAQRLREAGFEVRTVCIDDIAKDGGAKFGLSNEDIVFVARVAAAP